ncbi:MAG: DUF362 domain-containing protein [Promethearchaeota archaeon]
MTNPIVYFVDSEVDSSNNLFDKLHKLFNKTVGSQISTGDRVCLKTHFGKYGNMAYMRPALLRKMVDLLKEKGAIVALAETNGLGFSREGLFGGRSTATDYFVTAAKNGFSIGTMGAPLILLDGELGIDIIDYEFNDGKYLKKAHVARGIIGFDKTIVFTHAKCHGLTGLAGAIKNVGIGMVGKSGKADCHTNIKNGFSINQEECLGEKCSKCIKKCPVDCISFKSGQLSIDSSKCLHCHHCSSICNTEVGQKAINVEWISDVEEGVKRIVESACGVQRFCIERQHDLFYFNLVLDISPVCDCNNHTPRYIAPDIGILASNDPVAIDQASIDLINNQPPMPGTLVKDVAPGKDKFAVLFGKKTDEGEFKPMNGHRIQIEYAEKMRLGSSHYQLINLEK